MKFRTPSASLVISCIALFVALGGSSYAAVKLQKNSVTSREIKNGSVTLADLNKSIRPSKSSKLFRSAVVDTVQDPTTGLTIHVVSEPGPKGDKGDTGAGVAGPQGATGSSGPQGRMGESLAWGHIDQNSAVLGESVNLAVQRTPSTAGMYCVKTITGAAQNINVTLDANDAINAVPLARRPTSTSACAGWDFEVIIANPDTQTAIDHAFFVTLN